MAIRINRKDDENRTHNVDTAVAAAAGIRVVNVASAAKTPIPPAVKPISSKTKQDLYKQAAASYAKKLKFEKPLDSKMKQLFDQINKDFKANYTKTGIIPSISDYQKDVEKILNEHGVKVGNAFSSDIRNKLGKPSNNAVIQRKLEANIKGVAAQRSHLMSHSIVDTTRDNLDKAVKDAHVSLALEDEAITNNSVADLANKNLSSKFVSRAMVISITETQSAAETGKELEYSTMDDFNITYDDQPISELIQQKMWVAILDDHTREAHAEADGQTVGIDEPFEVDGEQLMYPGDDSMGASEGNLINCRCSAEDVIGD